MDLAELSLSIDSSPAVQATGALDQLAAAAAKVDAANAAMAASHRTAGAAVAGAAAAGQAGKAAQGEYSTATSKAAESIAAHTKAVVDNTKAHGSSSMAASELGHVFRSVFDEMQAGVPLTRALSMESGRLAQVIGSGGLGGGLSSLAARAAGLVNPFTLGAGAVIGFGAAAIYAATSYRSMREELERSLMGVGHISGLNAGGLNDLAGRSGSLTGLSTSDSRSAAETFAASGHLDADNMGRSLGLVRGYAGAFGTSYGEASKGLDDLFADPVKGADRMNERLGFLNDRTRELITTMRDHGDMQGAVRALIDASSTSLNEQAQKLGVVSQFFKNAADDAARFRDALGKAMTGPIGPMERMVEAERRLNNPDMISLMEQARRSADDFRRNPEAARGLAHMTAGVGQGASPYDAASDPWSLSEDVRRASQLKDMQQRDLIANRQSLSAGDITRATMPDIMARQKMQDDRDSLAKSLGNPDTIRDLGPLATAAFDALGRLNLGLATFTTSAERMHQDSAFRTASITADDAATKLLIDTQSIYARTMRDSKDAALAAAAAETTRAEAVANATKRISDVVISFNDRAALLGLRPAQRLEEEHRQELEKFQRENAIPAGTGYSAAGHQGSGALTGGFDAAVNRTLGFEGGRLAADTNGTPTQFGINAAYNPGVDLNALTVDKAKEIYRSKYWNPLHLDGASAGLQRVAFDTSVMEGPARANSFIKQSGGDADQFMDLRQKFEAGLLAKDPAKYGRFGTSWANRDAGLRLDLGKSGTMEGNPISTAGTDTSAGKRSIDSYYASSNQELFNAPFKSAAEQLGAMDRANAALAGSFSLSSDKVAGINERLKVENGLIAAGATSLDPYKAHLDEIERRWGAATKAAEDHARATQAVIGAMDDVRDGAKGFLDPLIQSGLHGTSVMAALHSGLESVASKLTGKLEDTALNSLFGASGTPGGGIFGSLLQSAMGNGMPAFATGTDDFASGGPALVGERGPEIVNLPAHAQVIPNNVAFGGNQSGGGDVHVHQYLDGARGDAHVMALARQGAEQVFSRRAPEIPAMIADQQRRVG